MTYRNLMEKILPTDDELYEDWLEVCRPFNGDETTLWLRGQDEVKAKVVAKARVNLEIANLQAVSETVETVAPAIDAAVKLSLSVMALMLAMSEPQDKQKLLEAIKDIGARNHDYLEAQIPFQVLRSSVKLMMEASTS